jgi:hypothetical protein
MKKNLLTTSIILFFGCNKEPYQLPYLTSLGYVIEKEYCKNDDMKEYWLIDVFSVQNGPEKIGDTVFVNGIYYNNVIKSTGLHDKIKIIGQKVAIDFEIDNSIPQQTTGCLVSNPVTYKLKVAKIHASGEAR